jgi:hypothetical protein
MHKEIKKHSYLHDDNMVSQLWSLQPLDMCDKKWKVCDIKDDTI